MSLDVELREGKCLVYSANITHNLNRMAEAAGIYMCLWRPEEAGITHAKQIIEPLAVGVADMATNKAKYDAYNSPNGWGLYENFLPWCAEYLQACRDHPEATVEVSR